MITHGRIVERVISAGLLLIKSLERSISGPLDNPKHFSKASPGTFACIEC
jgi:hypothetical protein